MGARDDTENVLRELHLLLSRAPAYNNSRLQAVINRNEALALLTRLNGCMTAMQEEYELIQSVRDRAERQLRREAEQVQEDARRKAEDVYAASMLYTDQALEEVKDRIGDVSRRLGDVYRDTVEALAAEQERLRTNQSELRGQLQDMLDSRKYLLLIEEENRRQAREDALEEEPAPTVFSPRTDTARNTSEGPEIVVNPEYFRKKKELEAAAREDAEAGPEAETPGGDDGDGMPSKPDGGRAAAASGEEASRKRPPVLRASESGEDESLMTDVQTRSGTGKPAGEMSSGRSIGGEATADEEAAVVEISEAEAEVMAAELSDELDRDYFAWQDEEEEAPQKGGFFTGLTKGLRQDRP